MTPELKIEFRQVDWEPGFAGYLDNGQPNGTAFCFLNLGTLLCAVAKGDLPKADLPYMIAESMMHEIIHVLEAWARMEFSEENVEVLLEKYRTEAGRVGTFWQAELLDRVKDMKTWPDSIRRAHHADDAGQQRE